MTTVGGRQGVKNTTTIKMSLSQFAPAVEGDKPT